MEPNRTAHSIKDKQTTRCHPQARLLHQPLGFPLPLHRVHPVNRRTKAETGSNRSHMEKAVTQLRAIHKRTASALRRHLLRCHRVKLPRQSSETHLRHQRLRLPHKSGRHPSTSFHKPMLRI